ncbi:hypothetical protein CVT26_006303 [Gymnopilus dilepis]|uniref:Uncharacterized protein n=1 Tax=Gymnopilus dilepis TaxID=231916 RepID=A0A409Y0L7_9AGAR|nr:hypothetical protein CVT26_006303 [Gymnopilus dilepis]
MRVYDVVNFNIAKVADIRDVQALVGIWAKEGSDWIYILRKHSALALLSEEERGLAAEEGRDARDLDDISDAVNI